MAYNGLRIGNSQEIPDAVRRSLGIGRFRAKIFQRLNGELITKAVQDVGAVIIKFIYINENDKAKSIELTETELRQILLMAKDVRKITGQQSEEEMNQAWLEE